MRRIKQHVTVGKCADIFGVKCGAGAKSSNDAKFTRQLATRLRRQISVQLDAFEAGRFCHGPNVIIRWVNEYANSTNVPRYRFDNLSYRVRFDVARTSRIKV